MLNYLALVGFFIWSGSMEVSMPNAVPRVPDPSPIELSVRLTGYNAVPEQTDSDPYMTAAGIRSNPEVVAARSRDLTDTLPFGTVIALYEPKTTKSCGYEVVEHLIGYRVIADTMHARKQGQVDILFDMNDAVRVGGKPMNPAIAIGVCNVAARVVGKLPVRNIPSTQEELALLVKGAFGVHKNPIVY